MGFKACQSGSYYQYVFCLIVVISYFEAGPVGIAIAVTIAVFGGILNRYFGVHTGVQYMVYYASPWLMLTLLGIK